MISLILFILEAQMSLIRIISVFDIIYLSRGFLFEFKYFIHFIEGVVLLMIFYHREFYILLLAFKFSPILFKLL